ncbi:hypothetical protein GCM10008938_37530 [Deinococcus roseus]|uniref:Uncharacterized protein n=2 Tax=Deinococcus roseus TaxID=392414 RepID=A0ABQ2D6L9_9DEIO|nr:hypothetical protein GCM10008938_37530 [Deinococcus roseus]
MQGRQYIDKSSQGTAKNVPAVIVKAFFPLILLAFVILGGLVAIPLNQMGVHPTTTMSVVTFIVLIGKIYQRLFLKTE